MPDLTAQANELKQAPDQAIQQELQHPTGAVAPFLVMSEAQRRQLTRQAAQADQNQGKSGSVYDDIVRSMMARQPPQNLPAAPAGMVPMGNATQAGPGMSPQNFQAPPARMMADGGLYNDEEDDDQFSSADPFLQAGSDPFLQSPQAQGIAAIGAPQGMEGATEASPEDLAQAGIDAGDLSGATEGSFEDFLKQQTLQKLKGGHGGRKGGHGGKRGGKGKGAAADDGSGGGKGGFKISKVLSALGKMGGASRAPHGIATVHPPHFSYLHPVQQHHAQGFHFASGGFVANEPSQTPGYTRWYYKDSTGAVKYFEKPDSWHPGSGRGRSAAGGSGRAPAGPKPRFVQRKAKRPGNDPETGKPYEGVWYHSYWEDSSGNKTGEDWEQVPQEMAGRSGQTNLGDLNKWMDGGGAVYVNGKPVTKEDLNKMGLTQFMYRPSKDGRGFEIYPMEFPTTQGWTMGQDQYGNPVPVWKGTTTKGLPGTPQPVPQVVPGMEPQGGAQPAQGGIQPAQGGVPGQGVPQAPGTQPPQQQPMQQPAQGGQPQQQPQAQYYRPREYEEGSGMPPARMNEQQYSIFSRRQAKAEPIRTAFTQMFGDRTDPASTGGYLGLQKYLDNPKYPDYATHVGRALRAVLDEGDKQVGGLGMSAGGEGFNINFGGIGDMLSNYFRIPIAKASLVQKVAEEQLSHLTPEEQEGFNYGLAALSVSPGIRTITAGAATNQQFNATAREVPLIGVNAFTRGQFVKRFTNLGQEFRNAAQFTLNAGVPRPITDDMLDTPERVRNIEAGKTITDGTVKQAADQWRINPEDVAKDASSVGLQIVPGPADERGLQRPRQTQQQIQAGENPGRADWFRENVAPQTNPPVFRMLRPEEVQAMHRWGLDEQGNPLTPEQIAALPPDHQPGSSDPSAMDVLFGTGPLPRTGSWWRDLLGLPAQQAPPTGTLPAGVITKPQPQASQAQPAPAPLTPAPAVVTPTPQPKPQDDEEEILRRAEEIRRRRAAEEQTKAQPAPAPAPSAAAPAPAPQQGAPAASSEEKWTGPLPWERNQQPDTEARGGRIFDRMPTRGETLSALTRR